MKKYIKYSSIDNYFHDHDEMNKKLLQSIKSGKLGNDFSLWNKYFESDQTCNYMIRKDDKDAIKVKCLNCHSLSNYTNDLEIDKKFVAEAGVYSGKYFKLTKEMKWTSATTAEINRKINNNQETILETDPITNYILLNIIIGDIIQEVPRMITGYRCCANTYYLWENQQDFTSNYETSDRVLNIGVVVQVIALMKRLQKNEFIDTNPDLKSFVFSDESISYMYDGFNVTAAKTVSIVPKHFSSIKYGKTKICAKKFYDVEETQYTSCVADKCNYFQINSNNQSEFIRNREKGTAYFPCSYELYNYIISLYSVRAFKNVFNSDLVELWKSMWVSDQERETIEHRIEHRIEYRLQQAANMKHTYLSHIEITHIILGINLNKDIVDIMWQKLKNIF